VPAAALMNWRLFIMILPTWLDEYNRSECRVRHPSRARAKA
jgi:hypothetical protein